MFSMLLEEPAKPSFFAQYGLLIILVVMLIAMFVINYFRQKKMQQQEAQMIQDIKVGTKVKTYAGVYGTIVGMYDTTDGKVAILSLDGKTTMEVDFRSIYSIDNKSEVKEEEVKEEVKTEEVAQPEQSLSEDVVYGATEKEEKPKAKKSKSTKKNQD